MMGHIVLIAVAFAGLPWLLDIVLPRRDDDTDTMPRVIMIQLFILALIGGSALIMSHK